MKKLTTIILLLISISAFSQRSLSADTLKIYGGGSFEGNVLLDTLHLENGGSIWYHNYLNDTLYLNNDTIISGGGFAGVHLESVNTENLSNTSFIMSDASFFKVSLAHDHPELLLKTSNNDLWTTNGDTTKLINATDIDIGGFSILNVDDPSDQLSVVNVNYLEDYAEPVLGNPLTNGFILSSTTLGVRSWTSPIWYNDINKVELLDAKNVSMQGFEILDLGSVTDDASAVSYFYIDKEADVYLTSTQVNTLGTAYELLPAVSGKYYVIKDIIVKITVATTLEVGAQGLDFQYATTDRVAVLSNASVETTSTKRFRAVMETKDYIMPQNSAFQMVMNAATDPTGNAQMNIKIFYTLETY